MASSVKPITYPKSPVSNNSPPPKDSNGRPEQLIEKLPAGESDAQLTCWWSEGNGRKIKYKLTDFDAGDVMNVNTGRRLSVKHTAADTAADATADTATDTERRRSLTLPQGEETPPPPPMSMSIPMSPPMPTATPAAHDASAGATETDASEGLTINQQILLDASEAKQLRERVKRLEQFIVESGLTPPL